MTGQENGKDNPGKTRPARLEVEDFLFMAGLVFMLVGLGLELGWGWGLAAVGAILVGMTFWMTTPAAGGGK